MSNRACDILVVGGGVVGLAFAGLLARLIRTRRPDLRIAVLEQKAPPELAPDADIGLRVLAIAPVARAILAACGAWDRLPPGRAMPFERMRVWQADSPPFGYGSIGFDAADCGLAELGHIVEHDWLRLALWRQLAGQTPGQVEMLVGRSPASLRMLPSHAQVVLDDGTSISASLVVGADGADSWVRAELKLATSARRYEQSAIVAHVSSAHSHSATAWQCFVPGGPVALLPLADGRSSVVWSCAEASASELLALGDPEFSARLTRATCSILGPLQVTTPRVAFPLAAQHTHRYTGPRFALIGDAAHQIHPLAGQGINLGLLDAAALAETLATNLVSMRVADPGDVRVLRPYERERKGANLLTLGGMEALHRLFTSAGPDLARAAGIGLGIVDHLPPVKRLLAGRATGLTNRIPDTALERYAKS